MTCCSSLFTLLNLYVKSNNGHYFIVIKGIVTIRELEVFAGDSGNGLQIGLVRVLNFNNFEPFLGKPAH